MNIDQLENVLHHVRVIEILLDYDRGGIATVDETLRVFKETVTSKLKNIKTEERRL